MRFVYYGASVELFFALLAVFIILFAIGIWQRTLLWNVVRGIEVFSNATGRFFAWAGLLMVLQQIVIVFMQRVFTKTDIGFGLGSPVAFEITWWAEELKLYNAMIVCMCCAYTFVQRGHVRVDLFYANLSYGGKRLIDMAGCVVLMIPSMIIIWFYSWFFLWRHLITPKVSASDTLDRMMAKSRAVRWNVETIGFSPNGFNAYFLFKVLIVMFCLMMLLQAVAFFFRCYLEWVEGPESEDLYHDADVLTDDDDDPAAIAAQIH